MNSQPVTMGTTATVREALDSDVLVARAREGDTRAFEALYRAHAPRVFGVCVRMAEDREEAEECSQDVWVRVWERLESFRGDSAFTSWLHRLTVNLILDRRRSAVRYRQRFKGDQPGTIATVSSYPLSWEDEMDIQQAVDMLPDRARQVFLLHDVEGYKHREIADRLGIAEGTAKAQLHWARRQLREGLSR